MIRAGTCVIDITPPAGLAMAGFGARLEGATGAHDALSVRALVVGDTALVTADVIGIDAALSARVRAACCLPARNVVITALHNHGGPVSMPGRLSAPADPAWMARLESALVEAIDRAAAARQPVRLLAGQAPDPGFARNRRHEGGPVDGILPVLRLDRPDGSTLAILTSYGCHPVVLGADNRLWTADYPHFLRARLESALPGAVALFATGCAGDVNTGHSAQASLTPGPQARRTYQEAARIGEGLAEAVLAAPLAPVSGPVRAAEAHLALPFARRESDPATLARDWRAQAAAAPPVRAHLLRIWADWAEALPAAPPGPLPARVSVLDWAGVCLAALPGEIFAQTALDLRARLARDGAGRDAGTDAPVFVLAYADDNPGYIPPRAEHSLGGYEVEEAHRFYGLPAGFAPGAAESLAEAALAAASDTGARPRPATTTE